MQSTLRLLVALLWVVALSTTTAHAAGDPDAQGESLPLAAAGDCAEPRSILLVNSPDEDAGDGGGAAAGLLGNASSRFSATDVAAPGDAALAIAAPEASPRVGRSPCDPGSGCAQLGGLGLQVPEPAATPRAAQPRRIRESRAQPGRPPGTNQKHPRPIHTPPRPPLP